MHEKIMESARYIVRRNLTPNVEAVTVTYDESLGRLDVTYIVSSSPTDDDVEFCELTFGEIAGAYFQVKSGTAECVEARDVAPDALDPAVLVYRRERT